MPITLSSSWDRWLDPVTQVSGELDFVDYLVTIPSYGWFSGELLSAVGWGTVWSQLWVNVHPTAAVGAKNLSATLG